MYLGDPMISIPSESLESKKSDIDVGHTRNISGHYPIQFQ